MSPVHVPGSSMEMIRLRAPAKLNLYLRVLGRQPDGYHEIETLFERIDLADELTFEPAPERITLTCSDPSLSCGDDNLILQAARQLAHASGQRLGARIHLEKRIPIAAGLGGGSSDAAATLLGLNQLWRLGCPRAELVRLAAALGSDVPFFLTDTAFAIGRGRGEQCEPLAVTRRLAQVLVVPPVPLSTREMYQTAQFDLTAPKPSISMIAHALSNGSLRELATGLWNDLEPEAIRRCPLIATILDHLRTLGCVGVCLSGSGAAVFGLCRDLAHAHAVTDALRLQADAPLRIEPIQTDGLSVTVTPSN